jgi:diguanylate cyclase (GGDEF)-like protein
VKRPYRLVAVGAVPDGFGSSPWGPFEVATCDTLDAVAAALGAAPCDAVVVTTRESHDAEALAAWPALSQAVLDAAVVVVAPAPSPRVAARLLALGVQDMLAAGHGTADDLARAVRLAIERKAIEKASRGQTTDLATGLPNHAVLLEQTTHLLALREREPAPMAVIVLRIEGTATAEARAGAVAANVLRRKAAVRLRSALRASDVVAAIGHDTFAVLLAWIDTPDAAQRVADKLAHALLRPFRVMGESLALAPSIGVSVYPEHGRDADTLLRRAMGLASLGAGVGREGFSNLVERGPASAAND